MAEMTTADWAILISLGSLTIAILSVVWNIWSKFIYPKPQVRTSISVMNLLNEEGTSPPFISMSATNHGPAEVTLYAAIAKSPRKWFLLQPRYAILNPMEGFPIAQNHSLGPFSGGLPKKLAIGEQFSVYFPITVEWFTGDNNLVRFGFNDTFDRNHWCSKKNAKEFRTRVLNKQAS